MPSDNQNDRTNRLLAETVNQKATAQVQSKKPEAKITAFIRIQKRRTSLFHIYDACVLSG